MRTLFKGIISHLKIYHYRLRNSSIRQIVRSSNYCLNEYNTDKTTRHICLFGMLMLMIVTTILVV